MIEVLTWSLSAAALLLTLYRVRARGVHDGARPVWILVLLLLPAWMSITLAGLKVDFRTSAACAILLGLLLQPYDPRRRSLLRASDLAIVALAVSMSVSQFLSGNFAALGPLDPLRDLALPYLVGRCFLRSPRDVDSILPAICMAVSLLAALAVFEGVAKLNPIDRFLGKSWAISDFEEANMGERWGLKRANGPQSHSIYLGLTFVMMMPWLIEAARRSWHGQGEYWWRFTPFWTLLGIVATGSRAAQIAVIIVFLVDFFHVHRRWRAPIFILFVILGAVFYTSREEIIRALSSYAQEISADDATVKINGVEHPYSGTKHRDLLYLVYEDAQKQAGWFGYGTRMEKMPIDPHMDERFISIDNHYLMFELQYGLAGLLLFALLAAAFLGNLLPVILWGEASAGRLAAGMFGAMVGVIVMMRGVWFAPDYGWVWLFCGGLTISLARLRQTSVPGARP